MLRPLHLLLFAFLVTLSACASTGAGAAESGPARVLLLGDSISIGYTSTVREEMGELAHVVRPTHEKGNAENCAGTTKGIEHIDRWLALDGGDWDLIHFNFGLHDLKKVDAETGRNSNDPGDPHQADPETYRAQLATITDAIVASGARVIFATTTPVPEGVRPYREPGDVGRYNSIAREVMEARGVAIDDLYGFALESEAVAQNPADVHYTAEGSRALGVEVARVVRAALEER